MNPGEALNGTLGPNPGGVKGPGGIPGMNPGGVFNGRPGAYPAGFKGPAGGDAWNENWWSTEWNKS